MTFNYFKLLTNINLVILLTYFLSLNNFVEVKFYNGNNSNIDLRVHFNNKKELNTILKEEQKDYFFNLTSKNNKLNYIILNETNEFNENIEIYSYEHLYNDYIDSINSTILKSYY